MKTRTQFNVRISANLVKRVTKEKTRCFKTRDIIAEVALDAFFSNYTADQRESFYRAHQPYARA